MPFFIPIHVANTFAAATDQCRDASGMRDKPECVVLGVAEGVEPSPKPPVRIFLGTEPAQYRAERIFVWSIEQVRDPSRVYEIHLMKELSGFNRRRWLTGFTNYRFAIPHYAGGTGRAIWNDVDMAYLSDPAELFDAEMGDHGFLAIAPNGRTDTAIMLLDCERMIKVWSLEDAQHGYKNPLIAKTTAIPGLRGDLAVEWHARDEEYVPGRTKMLHWTILHTQPWRPLPGLFVYQSNPAGAVWHDMKRDADAAGYQVFTADRPSAQYSKLLTRLQAAASSTPAGTAARQMPQDVLDLAAKADAVSILEYSLGAEDAGPGGSAIARYDPAISVISEPPSSHFDGVMCVEGMDIVPDEDVPWVVDQMFEHARRFVYVTVSDSAVTKRLPDGSQVTSRPRDRSWWFEHFENAARRNPTIHWTLALGATQADGSKPAYLREAGRCLGGMPDVWVLTNGTSENTAQSIALAEALGWPFEIKKLSGNETPKPPWPDVVISADDQTAEIARSIGQWTRGKTRLVQLDNKGSNFDAWADAVVTPAYYRLPPHPRRVETVTRLTRVDPDRLADQAAQAPDLFGDAPHPHVVVLAGDDSSPHPFDTATARRMGEEIRTFAESGSVFAFTGNRMGPIASGALVTGLGATSHMHGRRPGDQDNDLYLAYLAAADAFVVSGESEAMLADAVATGKPVYIYEVPERRRGLTERIEEAVLARSQARPLNRRGTVRPQQGPEYLCARLIERGYVRPPHDLTALHQDLFRRGVAQPFTPSPAGWRNAAALHEADDAAGKVRTLLGLIDP
jgi:mitochondrial fission protein ELM1